MFDVYPFKHVGDETKKRGPLLHKYEIEEYGIEIKNQYRIFANSRSGHHGIINWIISGLKGGVLFFDDIRLREDNAIAGYELNRINCECGVDNYLFNIENFDIKALDSIDWSWYSPFKSEKTFDIIVQRDPFNWLASTRRGKKKDLPIEDKIDIWKRAFLERGNKNYIYINFNNWVDDSEYRDFIAGELCIHNSEKAVDKMWHTGKSSFEGFEKKDRASQMDVLNRYKAFLKDESFKKLIDKDLVLYAREGFGITEECFERF